MLAPVPVTSAGYMSTPSNVGNAAASLGRPGTVCGPQTPAAPAVANTIESSNLYPWDPAIADIIAASLGQDPQPSAGTALAGSGATQGHQAYGSDTAAVVDSASFMGSLTQPWQDPSNAAAPGFHELLRL